MKTIKNTKQIILFGILSIVMLVFINISYASNSAKIGVETANLRESANANGKILKQLSLNDEVEIVEKSDNWYKVKTNGITGYIRQDLLKDINSDVEVKQNNEQQSNVTSTVTESSTEVVNNREETRTVENSQDEKTKIVVENIKLKIIPIISASDIVEIQANKEVTVLDKINDWVYVQSETAKGWIRSDKLKNKEISSDVDKEEVTEKIEEEKEQEQDEAKQEEHVKVEEKVEEKRLKIEFVGAETVNLRKEPNTNSEILLKLTLNMAVDVYSESNGWSKVKVSGKEGYISSSLLLEKKKETSRSAETPRTAQDSESKTTTEVKANSSNQQTTTVSQDSESVVETAKSYIGKASYVYGASGPNSFDCSGFTSYIYKQYGISLNRTAAGQYSNGTAVSKDELKPGDLVMFGKSGINHVGIYIGNGQMVHAANPSRGVTTDTINSGYYGNNYVGARRVN